MFRPSFYKKARRHGKSHVWLKDGKSTLDLFGKGFVSLNLAGSSADMSSLGFAARKLALPLAVIALNDRDVRQIYERSFVLIRPDGHVAWRGNSLPENPGDIFDRVAALDESRIRWTISFGLASGGHR